MIKKKKTSLSLDMFCLIITEGYSSSKKNKKQNDKMFDQPSTPTPPQINKLPLHADPYGYISAGGIFALLLSLSVNNVSMHCGY